MFCSTSITEHLLRGLCAAALIGFTLLGTDFPKLWRVLAAAGALLLMRGCPMCWLMGLFETLMRHRRAKP